MFIGVQNYDLRREHPDIDPTVCLYFARLLADVGKYFERGNVEFAKNIKCSSLLKRKFFGDPQNFLLILFTVCNLIKRIYKNDYSLVCFARVMEKQGEEMQMRQPSIRRRRRCFEN